MEIVSTNPVTLCNYEVMSLLQNIRNTSKKHKGQLATIVYETLRYLENTPCKTQTTELIQTFLKTLETFKLNRNEKLMLVNNPPQTGLEMQLIIDEGEERLNQEQVDELLEVVKKHFISDDNKNE